MRFDAIREAVAREVREDLDALRAQWKTLAEDSDDMESFVEWLHDSGRIGHDTFRSLHAGGDVVLTNFATLATYFGDEDDEEDSEEDVPLPEGGDTSLFPIRTRRPVLKLDPQGRFQYLGKLAAGAMGEIHIARDRDLQRKVAVKRMTDKVKRSSTLSARFYTEAQVTAQLDHPNIVPVYSLEPDPESGLTYTMKLIKGRTFSQLVADVRTALDAKQELDAEMDLAARLECFLRVCDAISYAHSRGVIHRDLKPDNIMVGKFGEVFVMDWGIARLGDRREALEDELVDVSDGDVGGHARTRVGTVIGTPAYMSPEQAEGNNDLIDGRSDEFALGLILYELVCLQQALRGRDTMSLLLKVQRAEIEPIRPYVGQPPVTPELKAIIRKATARNRDARYPHVKDLADDVRRHMRNEATKALPEGLYKRFQRWAARRTQWLMGALLFVGGVAAVSVIGALSTTVITMQMAEQREAQMSDLLGIVAGRTHDLDAYLLTYEGLLKVLSSNAIEAVERDPNGLGPAGDAYYVSEPFSPPDMADSTRYGTQVSIGWPVFKRREGVTLDEAMPSIRQLNMLRQPFRRLLLSSSSEDAVGSTLEQEKDLILEQGTPVAWAYVALENGVLAHYPGHDNFPSPYDATKRPWYKLVEGVRGPHWGSPHVDHGGLGLMLPCSMGLYDDSGVMLGVAGVELSFDFLIDQLLEAPELVDVAETYVLDTTGRIVIQSSDKKRADTDSALGKRLVRMKNFPYERVAAEALAQPSGYMTLAVGDLGERQIFVWYRMKSTGWTYLIRGPERTILRAMDERG